MTELQRHETPSPHIRESRMYHHIDGKRNLTKFHVILIDEDMEGLDLSASDVDQIANLGAQDKISGKLEALRILFAAIEKRDSERAPTSP
jgi:hypothetical protein